MATHPAPGTRSTTAHLASETPSDVETYFADGQWHTRRRDDTEPFASGESRERMIAIGAEVARWNGLRHIIRDPDGTIDEVDTYGAGPYPYRSPVRRQHR